MSWLLFLHVVALNILCGYIVFPNVKSVLDALNSIVKLGIDKITIKVFCVYLPKMGTGRAAAMQRKVFKKWFIKSTMKWHVGNPQISIVGVCVRYIKFKLLAPSGRARSALSAITGHIMKLCASRRRWKTEFWVRLTEYKYGETQVIPFARFPNPLNGIRRHAFPK